MMGFNSSFIILKPDGVRALKYEELSSVLSNFGISIRKSRPFNFNTSIIQFLWPHRIEQTISSRLMSCILQSDYSYLIDIYTIENINIPLANHVNEIKGGCFPGKRKKESIRGLLNSGYFHFNYIHAPDSHGDMLKEYIRLENECVKNDTIKRIKTIGKPFSIEESKLKIEDLLPSSPVKLKIRKNKSLNNDDLLYLLNFNYSRQNLDIYYLINSHLNRKDF
ncbi:nucleoside-diphosphate kinase [Pseudoalteromonas rubra]|uniref:nucleoside-diphosphate kinase n=1 Tax=Pseudoalteromonas rubra TaxID=43658 RepID=UPI000F7699BB